MEETKKTTGFETIDFEVVGAGQIKINSIPNVRCGGSKGFSFGVSWGIYGDIGGVLSREEARRLANHINSILDNL